MTNIEKIKRILDAGHWVKATSEGFIITITSYNKNEFTYLHDGSIHISTYNFNNYTIEVIQRIPTAYKAWDKVLVLSNPSPNNKEIMNMVWTVCIVRDSNATDHTVYTENKSDYYYFPSYCLAPAFDEQPTLSGKEAKIVIDGKEYTATLKLI